MSSASNHCCCLHTIGAGAVDSVGMVGGAAVFLPDLLGVVSIGAGAVGADGGGIGIIAGVGDIFARVDGAVETELDLRLSSVAFHWDSTEVQVRTVHVALKCSPIWRSAPRIVTWPETASFSVRLYLARSGLFLSILWRTEPCRCPVFQWSLLWFYVLGWR